MSCVVFDEQFVSGQGTSAAVQQAWDNFLASLTGTTYTQVTISGSLDPTGVTCSDPVAVNQLANALNTNAAASVQCNSRTWTTNPSCVGGELSAGIPCSSSSDYVVRPKSTGECWGNASYCTCSDSNFSCGAVDQRLRVEFC